MLWRLYTLCWITPTITTRKKEADMLTISRRKIALDPPLYSVLMDDLVLQSKHPVWWQIVELHSVRLSALGGTWSLHQWRQFDEKRLIHQKVFVRARFPVTWMICTMREFPVVKEGGLEKRSVIKMWKPPEAEVPTFYFSASRESSFHLNIFYSLLCVFFFNVFFVSYSCSVSI